MENLKFNEILYFELNEKEQENSMNNFKFVNNKEIKKAFKNQNSYLIKKIRVLSNQNLLINAEHKSNINENEVLNTFTNNINDQNNSNINNTKIKDKEKEINFFGLLLKASKEFLTPSYNVIIHLNGGGCFSQTSESHLIYLKK